MTKDHEFMAAVARPRWKDWDGKSLMTGARRHGRSAGKRFQAAGMTRETEAMSKEDVKIDKEGDKKKPHPASKAQSSSSSRRSKGPSRSPGPRWTQADEEEEVKLQDMSKEELLAKSCSEKKKDAEPAVGPRKDLQRGPEGGARKA